MMKNAPPGREHGIGVIRETAKHVNDVGLFSSDGAFQHYGRKAICDVTQQEVVLRLFPPSSHGDAPGQEREHREDSHQPATLIPNTVKRDALFGQLAHEQMRFSRQGIEHHDSCAEAMPAKLRGEVQQMRFVSTSHAVCLRHVPD